MKYKTSSLEQVRTLKEELDKLLPIKDEYEKKLKFLRRETCKVENKLANKVNTK